MSRRGTVEKGVSNCGFVAQRRAYAMTLGLWPSGMVGYMISQPGEATPPRTSTPWRVVSLRAVPMVSNHGSCMRNKLVPEPLFSRAWVTAFLLHMFTDATVTVGGCTAIKGRVQRQRQVVGTRESMLGVPRRMCPDLQGVHCRLPWHVVWFKGWTRLLTFMLHELEDQLGWVVGVED
jgi:hypothetical protein